MFNPDASADENMGDVLDTIQNLMLHVQLLIKAKKALEEGTLGRKDGKGGTEVDMSISKHAIQELVQTNRNTIYKLGEAQAKSNGGSINQLRFLKDALLLLLAMCEPKRNTLDDDFTLWWS